MRRRPPTSTLFPYTTLFRSHGSVARIPIASPIAVWLIAPRMRSEEHTSELQSHSDIVCRLLLEKKKRKIAIENNYSAQMAGLIREQTAIAMDNSIVKFDGRPFSQNEIYEGVKDIIKNEIKEVTVSHA